jgi:hypothetical protein
MSAIADLIKDLLIFVVVIFVLLIVLLVVISRMLDDNPLKRIFNALAFRLGATMGVGVLAIPIEPIPGLDGLYDIAGPLFLLYYWFTFIRKTLAVLRTTPSPPDRRRRRP